MRYKLSLSVLTGVLIGGLLGIIYYAWVARILLKETIPMDGFPPTFFYVKTLRWGVIPGAIVGFLGGLNTSAEIPRGLFSRTISTMCFLVCTPIGWINNFQAAKELSFGWIALTILLSIVLFFMSLMLGQGISFMEKIREAGGPV